MKYLSLENIKRIEEIKNLINNEITDFDNYTYVGIRFEDKEYSVGDICLTSKSNPDRDDERVFPDYGTEEYTELEDLNGACAWNLDAFNWTTDHGATEHAYIIAGNDAEYGEDEGEIIIEDAKVLEILF